LAQFEMLPHATADGELVGVPEIKEGSPLIIEQSRQFLRAGTRTLYSDELPRYERDPQVLPPASPTERAAWYRMSGDADPDGKSGRARLGARVESTGLHDQSFDALTLYFFAHYAGASSLTEDAAGAARTIAADFEKEGFKGAVRNVGKQYLSLSARNGKASLIYHTGKKTIAKMEGSGDSQTIQGAVGDYLGGYLTTPMMLLSPVRNEMIAAAAVSAADAYKDRHYFSAAYTTFGIALPELKYQWANGALGKIKESLPAPKVFKAAGADKTDPAN
jgi:hypothetical protein